MAGAPRDRSRRRRLVALAVALAAVVAGPPVAGADPASGPSVVARWGIADGLPQSSVTSLIQARDGYIWLTTFGGIVRFDGLSFVVYNLANTPALRSNRFVASHVDVRGDLWFGGEQGELVRYRAGRFVAIAMPGHVERGVLGMTDGADGALHVVTGSGAFVIHGDIAVAEPEADQPATDLAVAPDGRMWGITARGPVCLQGPCRGPAVTAPTDGWPTMGVTAARAADGRLWFVGPQAVWTLAPGADTPTLARELGRSSPYDVMRGVAIDDRRQRVWVSAGRTLWRRDGVDGPWVAAGDGAAPVLRHPMDAIRCLLVDREGGLWVGTDRDGLARLRDPDTEHHPLGGDASYSAFSVLEDRDGRPWVTGNCSPLMVRGADGGFAPHPGPARCPLAMALAADGAVWVGDAGRVHRHAGADIRTVVLPDDLAGASVQALAFDAAGRLWVGTNGAGVIRLEPAADGALGPGPRWTAAELGSGHVAVITVVGAAGAVGAVGAAGAAGTDDGVWIGTAAGAVRVTAAGQLSRLDRGAGLAPGTIRDIEIGADGATWFASYGGGLSRLAGGALVTVTSRRGLCDDTVSRIIEVDGELWLNGNRGVSHVPIADVDQLARGERAEIRCRLLRSGEGNGGVQPAGWRGADGRLWFPTIDGVVAVDPRPDPAADVAPLAVIERASDRRGELDLGDGGRLALPAGDGDVEVRYTGLAFDAPTQLRFRHRLRGLDDVWVEAGPRRSVTYTNLPPGDYAFEVTVQNMHGLWSPPARLRFTIAPHLWQTRWFQLAAGVAGVLLVVGLVQLRIRAVRHRNRALQAEVIERQHAEARALEQERHYRTLFERTTDGLFVHDPGGRLIEVNAAACTLVGLDRAALLARGLAACLAAGDRAALAALVEAGAAGRSPAPIDVVLERDDGERRHLQVHATPFAVGAATHVFCAAVDVSAARRAEAQRRDFEQRLQQGQKLEALGLLAGGIAHDFNNHLTAIGACSAVIRDRAGDADVAARAADIGLSVERASALVHKLLVFGRPQPGNVRDLDPAETVAGLVPLLRRLVRADIELTHVADGPAVLIRVDPVLFEQSLMNLVVNARDAIVGAGTITLTTSVRTVDAELAGPHRVTPGRYAVIAVADTGAGIDAATRARMFDPFFTTKELGKGTGLGLTVTHATVEKAAGFIVVESTVGVGSTFALHVPVVDPAAATALERRVTPVPVAPAPGPARSATILLCDDDELVRRSLFRLLELHGHRVIDAGTPERALALFAAEPTRFDLVLSDVVLPGFSGAELARRIRAVRATVPVVLISGHTRDIVVEAMDERTHFLKKPFSGEALAAVLRAALA